MLPDYVLNFVRALGEAGASPCFTDMTWTNSGFGVELSATQQVRIALTGGAVDAGSSSEHVPAKSLSDVFSQGKKYSGIDSYQ
jgi:hypothetical protein